MMYVLEVAEVRVTVAIPAMILDVRPASGYMAGRRCRCD